MHMQIITVDLSGFNKNLLSFEGQLPLLALQKFKKKISLWAKQRISMFYNGMEFLSIGQNFICLL